MVITFPVNTATYNNINFIESTQSTRLITQAEYRAQHFIKRSFLPNDRAATYGFDRNYNPRELQFPSIIVEYNAAENFP